ncbi:MAG: methyltransferase [Chitinophagaceae bacterium]
MFQFKQFTILQDRCAMKVTEVACLFGAWVNIEKSISILDIGTGTGLLSLMMAQRKKAQYWAIEIEENSFKQAQENISSSPFFENIKLYHSDIRNFNPEIYFDTIVCNPPFFENQLKASRTEKNKAWHEESLTLKNLLICVKQFLNEYGTCYLMLPYLRLEELKIEALQQHLYLNHSVMIKHTAAHKPKVFFGVLSNVQLPYSQREIILKNELGTYSEEVVNLLSAYYIHL